MHYDYKELQNIITGKGINEPIQIDVKKGKANTESKYFENCRKNEFTVELTGLIESLNILETWGLNKKSGKYEDKSFFVFFQDAILGAYFRYYHSKKAAWSIRRNVLFFVCSAILPVVAAVVLQIATAGNSTPIAMTGLILTGGIALVWVFSSVYTKWHDLCDHRETWVRHSVCYGRLRLALSCFVISGRQDKDYEELVNATFRILQQNYDQFMQNMCDNGVAKCDSISFPTKETT